MASSAFVRPWPTLPAKAALDRGRQTRQFLIAAPGCVGHPAQRLRNDRVCPDLRAEHCRSDVRNCGTPFFRGSLACHGRRRADADRWSLRIADPSLEAPHQHRHVRSLPSSIRVQFVEHDEPQASAVLDDLSVEIVLPRHEQFEHHEVCQQDVRWIVLDALAFFSTFLTGVSCKGRGVRVAPHQGSAAVPPFGCWRAHSSGRRRWHASSEPRRLSAP